MSNIDNWWTTLNTDNDTMSVCGHFDVGGNIYVVCDSLKMHRINRHSKGYQQDAISFCLQY